MGLKLVRGRFLTDADREDTMPAVVINETMAARYWPNEDAVGRQFMMGTDDKPWLTIVGVVGTVRSQCRRRGTAQRDVCRARATAGAHRLDAARHDGGSQDRRQPARPHGASP
jgi:hypothetical protein